MLDYGLYALMYSTECNTVAYRQYTHTHDMIADVDLCIIVNKSPCAEGIAPNNHPLTRRKVYVYCSVFQKPPERHLVESELCLMCELPERSCKAVEADELNESTICIGSSHSHPLQCPH